VPIKVDVNPTKESFDAAVASNANLSPNIPPTVTVDNEAEITASLAQPLSNGVNADVALAPGETSVPVTIQTDLSITTGTNWKWKVTAATEGVVELVFNVRLTGKAGDQLLDTTVRLMKSVRAEDPWWKTPNKVVLFLTPFLLFAIAAIALREKFKKKKKKKKKKSPPDHVVDPGDLAM
jgi:hypothetical protein